MGDTGTSETSSYDSSKDTSTVSRVKQKKKIRYSQTFRNSWLQEERFKPWLRAPSAGSKKPQCSACDCKLTVSKSAIDRHGNSPAHLRAVRTLENQPKICTEQQPKQDYLLLTQAKVAAFLSENNLPFSLSPALTVGY